MTIFGTLWPKQNNPVIWLRHNGGNKHLATPLSVYLLDMLGTDLFPIYLTQNHYFYFYFFTLAFYFVPSLDNSAPGAISGHSHAARSHPSRRRVCHNSRRTGQAVVRVRGGGRGCFVWHGVARVCEAKEEEVGQFPDLTDRLTATTVITSSVIVSA